MTQSNWQIIIAERGWVYVGRVSRDGDQVLITDAQNIRRWGTTKGLGELAQLGPRPDTQLDPYGTVRIHVLAVIGAIECDDAPWNAWQRKNSEPPRAKK